MSYFMSPPSLLLSLPLSLPLCFFFQSLFGRSGESQHELIVIYENVRDLLKGTESQIIKSETLQTSFILICEGKSSMD